MRRFNWLYRADCLMDNYDHLLIETPDGNLSKGMRQLKGVYTQNAWVLRGKIYFLSIMAEISLILRQQQSRVLFKKFPGLVGFGNMDPDIY